MYKMFLFNGTGSELITLQDIFYVDYTGQVIHNLTSIYGEGNEPTLETHETLIPQYTNTVLKAKEFSENLQQEYMQMSLDSVVYEGLSLRDIVENYIDIPIGELNNHTLREVFEDGNLVVNGDFSDGTTGWTSLLKAQVINDKLNVKGENDIARAQQPKVLILNNDYYFRLDIQLISIASLSSNIICQIFGYTTPAKIELPNTTLNDVKSLSMIHIPTLATSNVISLGRTTNQTFEANYDNVYLVDRTSLGIDHLTVEQMDYYYEMYQDFKDVYVGDKVISFTTAPTQNQLDTWLATYLYLNDKKAVMEDVLDKTVTLTGIPTKAKIYKDRFVILGKFVIIGE
jgi:hypothetical protein